jgi:hypothetical protein
MITTPVEVEKGAAAVAQACRQFTELLRSAPDPAAVAVGSWTAAETAAHVAEIIDVETAMVEGRGSPPRSCSPDTAASGSGGQRFAAR